MAVVFVIAAGCREIDTISSGLNRQTEPTYGFWARLQGVQYREFPEVQAELESVKGAAADYNLDQMAAIFSRVGDKHARIADLLSALDADKVDEDAVAYRDRLQQAHRNLGEAYRNYSASVAQGDFAAIQAAKTELPELTQTLATVWSQRTDVMSQLQDRYSRDFDVVD
ncbi:MAG: hypothetical protein KY475_05140 [Planctomycetes bacterium]|nr:hypothetical protein [Planctomycetota bacterium]